MPTFLRKTILFISFTIGLIIVIQLIISIRIKGESVTGHDNLEQTSNINADLVFIGSSRCWDHFDPNFFDSTYNIKSVNIGVDGHSELTMDLVRLQLYLIHNKSPKAVILNFDPFIRGGSLNRNTNFIHKDNFARYAFLPKKENIPIIDYFKFNNYEKYIPLFAIFKYKLLAKSLLLNNVSNYMVYGYQKNDMPWDTISNPVSDTLKYSYFKGNDIPSIKYELNKLNDFCIANKIKLICIQTPVYKCIYDKVTFNFTRSICNELNIDFIDLNHEKIINNIIFFNNSNHLNTLGVKKMNTILINNDEFNFLIKEILPH